MKDLFNRSLVSRIPLLALLGLLSLGLWPTHGMGSRSQETPVRIPFEPTVTYGEGYGEKTVAQQAQSRFALKLFDHLLRQQPQENLFFSPLEHPPGPEHALQQRLWGDSNGNGRGAGGTGPFP